MVRGVRKDARAHHGQLLYYSITLLLITNQYGPVRALPTISDSRIGTSGNVDA